MDFKDYYTMMGLGPDATREEVRRAYRQLARKYHPDLSRAPHAAARFQDLGEAYQVLSDLEMRAAYDQLGERTKAAHGFWPVGGAFTALNAFGGGDDGFDSFFESLYGRPMQGVWFSGAGSMDSNRHIRVRIDLEDAYTGASRGISLKMPEINDQGHVRMRRRTLQVAIPRGIRAGQHIRLVGQGQAGGKLTGDLYLEIEFAPHPLYRVDQRDVYFDLRIAPWEAALGGVIEIPTPQGAVNLRIPPGVLTACKLRLKGRGIPGVSPGDFYAVVQIVLPRADDEGARACYTHMAGQFRHFNPRQAGC